MFVVILAHRAEDADHARVALRLTVADDDRAAIRTEGIIMADHHANMVVDAVEHRLHHLVHLVDHPGEILENIDGVKLGLGKEVGQAGVVGIVFIKGDDDGLVGEFGDSLGQPAHHFRLRVTVGVNDISQIRLFFLPQSFFLMKRADVEFPGRFGRDPAGRGVRLVEVPGVLERGHVVAHCSRGNAQVFQLNQLAGADRLCRGDVFGDNRRQEGLLTRSDCSDG